FNQNLIFSGEGFRYTNDGTGAGSSESIPIRFRNSTGSSTVDDTLVINITSATPPTITTQPTPFTQITSAQTAAVRLAATGPGTLSDKWYSGIAPNASNPIAGATSTTFTTPVLSVGGQYLYWVQVTNLGGAANSLNATVQVNEATTTVATPPATIT